MSTAMARKRILVLEDEALVAMVLEDMLAELGITVVGPAATIEEALQLVESEPFDAAILDMNVDGSNSLPVADALAARGLPYAFASGMPDAPSGIHARAPLMPKPYRDSDLQLLLSRFFPPMIAEGPAIA